MFLSMTAGQVLHIVHIDVHLDVRGKMPLDENQELWLFLLLTSCISRFTYLWRLFLLLRESDPEVMKRINGISKDV